MMPIKNRVSGCSDDPVLMKRQKQNGFIHSTTIYQIPVIACISLGPGTMKIKIHTFYSQETYIKIRKTKE